MNPAAIGAALLLHTAAIGTILHLGSEPLSFRTGHAHLEVALLSGATAINRAARAPAAAPAARNLPSTNAVPSSVKMALASHSSNSTNQQETAPTGAEQASSPASMSSSGHIENSGVSIPANYAANNRKPDYPLLSRRQEEQGTVFLRIYVHTDGTAGKVHLKKSSGYTLLDESALRAVRNWHFRPAIANNKPIAEWYQLAIPFKLDTSLH